MGRVDQNLRSKVPNLGPLAGLEPETPISVEPTGQDEAHRLAVGVAGDGIEAEPVVTPVGERAALGGLDLTHAPEQRVIGLGLTHAGRRREHRDHAEELRRPRDELLLKSHLGQPLLPAALGVLHQPLLATDGQRHVLARARLGVEVEQSVGVTADDDPEGALQLAFLEAQVLEPPARHRIDEARDQVLQAEARGGMAALVEVGQRGW